MILLRLFLVDLHIADDLEGTQHGVTAGSSGGAILLGVGVHDAVRFDDRLQQTLL
jgi:hypothetical protein